MKPASGFALWRRIAARFRPYRPHLALSLVLVILSVALSAISPLLLRWVIDKALPEHDTGLLGWLCGAMIAAGVLSQLIYVGQGALTNRIGQYVIGDLRVDVYDRVRHMSLDFFSGEANSEIQARLVSDIGGINGIITYTAQSVLFSVTSLITSFVVMAILSRPLALISRALALLLNMVNNKFARRSRELARQRQDEVSAMLRLTAEDLSLSGVLLGRTLGRHPWQRARFVRTSQRIADLTYQERLTGRGARALIGITFTCLPPVVYWLAGTLASGITLGTVVVIATLQARLLTPIQQLLGVSTDLQNSLPMFERVFAYLDLTSTVRLDDETCADPVLHANETLRLRGVTQTYDVAGRNVLDDLTLEIPERSLTVVVGETGAGKSTLGLVLTGLLVPTSGTVEIPGRGPLPDQTLRRLATLVPQEAVLFNASLRENLLFARPEATPDEIAEALDIAHLDLSHLPDGLDTRVGERGCQLSGGERQRIALARALLAPHPVLVLDEATSALDAVTAERVHQAVTARHHDRTLIMITHRIPSLRPHDRVAVLDGGRLVDYGRHAELLTRPGPYATLLSAQKREPHPV